eukprot:5089122-Prymnesium_polylepis.1
MLLGTHAGLARGWLGTAHAPEMQHLLLAAAWCGLVTCALTTWAQSYAQQAFKPTTAALAYALEPVFAALFAGWMLNEQLAGAQAVGAALVVLANLAAAAQPDEDAA